MNRQASIAARGLRSAALALIFCVLAWPSGAVAAPPNFQNETLIVGLNQPTTLTFTPDGRMLILGRYGTIWVAQPGAAQVDPTPFNQMTNVETDGGERGLVGIALDPGFATNGYYYVFYTAASPLRDRVSRFTASGNSTLAGSETVIWQESTPAELYHHGGTVAFGPDGRLYISTGDGFDNISSQSLTSSNGKILRINPDGTDPTDNPFFDGAGPNVDAIWALGLRNPFRFSVDLLSGRMYIADVGGNSAVSSIEEINLGAWGANYGWPLCEGACADPGMANPVFAYPHGGRDSSVTGGFVYQGTVFPPEYRGSYFYGDYVRNWIRRLTFDEGGNLTGSVNFEPEDGAADGPYGEIVDLKEGPDGALYYVDIGISWEGQANPGSIRRIRYTANNQPPVAVASAIPTRGLPPLAVNFSSAGSSDPEDQPLTYSWTFGDNATSTDPNPSHTYGQAGPYTARLSVSDGVHTTLSDPIDIAVGNAPTGMILAPASGTTFRAGDTIVFNGTASDPEDGALPASAFSWTILFLHDSHAHPHLGPITNTAGGSFVIAPTGHDYSGNTRYQIILTVTDSDGLPHSSAVLVLPQKVDLSFATSPTGLTLRLDGITVAPPFVLDTLVGFQHLIEAPHQGQYAFVSWSDGGAQAHTITAPSAGQSYTATYQASLPSGLVVGYALSEGTGSVASDASGNDNHGTIAGATWTSAGRYGGALAFDGVNDRVTGPTLSLAAAFTYCAWIYNPSNASYETILTVGANRDLYLASGTPTFYTGGADLAFGSALTTNAWHHLAAVYDGSTLTVYVDGSAQGSPQTAALAPYSGTLGVGAWQDGAADFFGGRIDEVRIYNRALTQSEVQGNMSTPLGSAPPDTTPPLRSNGSPAGTLPAGTTQTTIALLSSESATCRYATAPGVAFGAMTSVFAVTGGTSHSTQVSGLADGGSYAFYVRCQDVAANANPDDFVISFAVASPPPPDTTSPTVAVTAPANGASVSGTIAVTAAASDNVGVAGVQFLLDGANLGSEDTTQPYSISWDTTGAANGPHGVAARARDAAGNVATSAVVPVTVANAAASPLALAYAFNEGNGATTADASGNGRTGNLVGASWTSAGRYGNALSFDGVNDRVTGPSLSLTGTFTYEAWIYNPSNATAEPIVTVGANRELRLRSGRLRFNTGTLINFNGTLLATNTWHHVAVVGTGTTLRAYLNGSPYGTPQNVSLGTYSGAVSIGSRTTGTSFFGGRIDEVRIYTRALSQSEIQADRDTPLN